MEFKKIQLTGFKSFIEKTTFLIESGLTGIVGPNGCGKSNIVESLRWCMGETSAKSMRGSGMEDVIFSGTANKPSKNIAEVIISLGNTEKDGPIQFRNLEKIDVKRRIEKDKGSKYFINEKEVRARDAQTFFADLSTGAHSPSIIGQGRIGALVTAKPSDRRAILEEAAGISGIHARRHESELRLNSAENNLKRADELRRQQEKQLENLKKQAEQATKYKMISEEIKKFEAGLYYLKLQNIENDIKLEHENVSESDDEVSGLTIELNHSTELLEKENLKLKPLRDKNIEILSKLQRLNLEIKNLEEQEEKVKERLREIGLDENFKIEIVNSTNKEKRIKYTQLLYEKLQREGLLEIDCDRLIRNDRVMFGSCMVASGDADAMVTGNTRRYSASLDKIKRVIPPRPGEIMFALSMVVNKGKTIFMADTHVHEYPNAQQLADIATSCARVVRLFGFDPKIAFLSHSTFGIPITQRTKHIRDAVEILKNKSVDFKFDGEMQPDVALDEKYKELYPFSKIVGSANVLIMPAQHSAAISLKMMKTLGGAKIIGPFLVGLGQPIEIAPLRSSTGDILNLASVAAYSSEVIDYKKN